MKEENTKFIIVGAGLSGLVTGYKLLLSGEKNFLILESRDQVGGRIVTSGGIDLGATWFQYFHTHFAQLLTELGIERFEQYAKGKNMLVHSNTAPAHFFKSDPSGQASYRVKGGSIAIINACLLYTSPSPRD